VKLLLTGFEPFGGASINPSEQVVQSLNGKLIQGLEIAGCILPVDQRAWPRGADGGSWRSTSRMPSCVWEKVPGAL
jgi:hypothetical protein